MNTNKLAYLAGILDGEGYIGAERREIAANGGYKKNLKYDVRVQIYNTDPRLMDYLVADFGGKIFAHPVRKPKKHKRGYQWRVIAGKAEELLVLILPYLKIKREQAELALKLRKFKKMPKKDRYFWKGFKNPNPKSPAVGVYTVKPEVVQQEICLIDQLFELNKKGPPSAI